MKKLFSLIFYSRHPPAKKNHHQKLTVIEPIDLAVADHQMYSDYNRATLKFLNSQCQ